MNPWLQRLYWISAITLFAGLPTSKALTSIGIGLMGICAIIEIFRQPIKVKPFLPILGFGSLFIFYCCSAFYSDSLSMGFNQSLRQHAFLSVPLCWWALSGWLSPRLPKLLNVFIAATTFHCFLTILFFLLPENIVASIADALPMLRDYQHLTDRLKFGLYTPLLDRLNFAYLIGFGLLYLVYDAVQHGITWTKVAAGITLLIAFALIGARGAQLAFLVAVGVGVLSYALAYIRSLNLSPEVYQQRLAAVVISLMIVLLAGPYLAYKTIPAVQKRYDQLEWEMRLIDNGEYLKEEYQYFTSLTRIRAWNNGWDIIKDNPIIGVGIGDYKNELVRYNTTYNDKVPAHNQNFFTYIWGAAGLLAFIGFIGSLWIYTRSFWSDNRHSIGHLVIAFVVFLVVSSFIDAFLKYHTGSISVMTILSSLFLIRLYSKVTDN